MADRYAEIASAMNRDQFCRLPEFLERFFTIRHENGVKTILQAYENDVVLPITEDAVIDSIVCYCSRELAGEEGFRFDQATAKKCMLYWKAVTEPIKDPPLLREKSERGLCYRRLPFDLVAEPDKTPLFGEFLSRCDNAHAFQMFVGSLLCDKASRHQYVWMYGQGGEGKSSILRVLARLLGNQYHAEDANCTDSKYWTSAIIGKRLVGFPDCNNYALPMTGLFKSLTGDDQVRVERKNKDPYSTELRCMVIVLSNQPPQLSGFLSDLRRAIICQVLPITGEEDTDYTEKLWAEAPYFFGCCKKLYLDHCQGGKKIQADMAPAELLAHESEEHYDQVFRSHFARCQASQFDKKLGIPAHVLKSRMELEGIKRGQDQRNFILFIKRKYKVQYFKPACGGFYYGIRLLDATEQEHAKRQFFTDKELE